MVGATDPCAAPVTPRAAAQVLEHIGEAYVAVDAYWRFTYVNAQAEQIYKRPREHLIGNTLWQMYPRALGTEFERVYRRAMAERIESRVQAPFPQLGGWFSVKVYPLDDGGLAFYFSDVTDRHRAEKHLACHRELLKLIFAGEPLGKLLNVITTTLEAISIHPVIASIVLADADSGQLQFGISPAVPECIRKSIDRISIATPELGPCAAAAFGRETVVVEKIAEHPSEGFRQFARQNGLHAAWATPIVSPDGVVLGTLALYYRESLRPPPEQEESARLLANLAALLILHHTSKQAHTTATKDQAVPKATKKAARCSQQGLARS